MLLKNRGGGALLGILPLRFLMELAATAYYLTRYPGGLRKSGSVFRAMGQVIILLPETLRKRRLVQSMRKVGERAIFPNAIFPASPQVISSLISFQGDEGAVSGLLLLQ